MQRRRAFGYSSVAGLLLDLDDEMLRGEHCVDYRSEVTKVVISEPSITPAIPKLHDRAFLWLRKLFSVSFWGKSFAWHYIVLTLPRAKTRILKVKFFPPVTFIQLHDQIYRLSKFKEHARPVTNWKKLTRLFYILGIKSIKIYVLLITVRLIFTWRFVIGASDLIPILRITLWKRGNVRYMRIKVLRFQRNWLLVFKKEDLSTWEIQYQRCRHHFSCYKTQFSTVSLLSSLMLKIFYSSNIMLRSNYLLIFRLHNSTNFLLKSLYPVVFSFYLPQLFFQSFKMILEFFCVFINNKWVASVKASRSY